MPTLAVWDFQNKTYWLFPEVSFANVCVCAGSYVFDLFVRV